MDHYACVGKRTRAQKRRIWRDPDPETRPDVVSSSRPKIVRGKSLKMNKTNNDEVAGAFSRKRRKMKNRECVSNMSDESENHDVTIYEISDESKYEDDDDVDFLPNGWKKKSKKSKKTAFKKISKKHKGSTLGSTFDGISRSGLKVNNQRDFNLVENDLYMEWCRRQYQSKKPKFGETSERHKETTFSGDGSKKKNLWGSEFEEEAGFNSVEARVFRDLGEKIKEKCVVESISDDSKDEDFEPVVNAEEVQPVENDLIGKNSPSKTSKKVDRKTREKMGHNQNDLGAKRSGLKTRLQFELRDEDDDFEARMTGNNGLHVSYDNDPVVQEEITNVDASPKSHVSSSETYFDCQYEEYIIGMSATSENVVKCSFHKEKLNPEENEIIVENPPSKTSKKVDKKSLEKEDHNHSDFVANRSSFESVIAEINIVVAPKIPITEMGSVKNGEKVMSSDNGGNIENGVQHCASDGGRVGEKTIVHKEVESRNLDARNEGSKVDENGVHGENIENDVPYCASNGASVGDKAKVFEKEVENRNLDAEKEGSTVDENNVHGEDIENDVHYCASNGAGVGDKTVVFEEELVKNRILDDKKEGSKVDDKTHVSVDSVTGQMKAVPPELPNSPIKIPTAESVIIGNQKALEKEDHNHSDSVAKRSENGSVNVEISVLAKITATELRKHIMPSCEHGGNLEIGVQCCARVGDHTIVFEEEVGSTRFDARNEGSKVDKTPDDEDDQNHNHGENVSAGSVTGQMKTLIPEAPTSPVKIRGERCDSENINVEINVVAPTITFTEMGNVENEEKVPSCDHGEDIENGIQYLAPKDKTVESTDEIFEKGEESMKTSPVNEPSFPFKFEPQPVEKSEYENLYAELDLALPCEVMGSSFLSPYEIVDEEFDVSKKKDLCNNVYERRNRKSKRPTNPWLGDDIITLT